MNTSGGFLLDASQEVVEAGPSRSVSIQSDQPKEGGDDHDSIAARKLTSKQELKLMNYLDEAFLQINRGYSKRYNSKTSSVPNLNSFLKAFDSILVVVASIPPIGPSAILLVSYLLRLTSELLDGIAGYEVDPDSAEIDDKSQSNGAASSSPHEQLQQVIQCLGLLDRVWSCVLRGQLVDLNVVKRNVDIDSQKDSSDDYFSKDRRIKEQNQTMQSTNGSNSLSTGRYPPPISSTGNHLRESKSIIGSKGFSTVGQTDRIRLRNVITLGKENIFSWMRIQLHEPLPPKVDEEEEEEEKGRKDELKIEPELEGEEDLEEVDTDQRIDVKEKRHNSHFDDLFARKIDPDASDSDNDEEEAAKESDSPHPPSPKRQRRRQESEEETRQDSPKEAESVATFSGTAAVMKWDIKFARLFANTLRCLSDIQEYDNHKEASRKTDNGRD